MGRDAIRCIITPKQGNRIPDGVRYCADNGCFGKGYPGDDAWRDWVAALPLDRCDFVVAPDVVGDAAATLLRSEPHLEWLERIGAPRAFVAQDGAEIVGVPWGMFDVLFIGGSTEWKLGPEARDLVAEAKRFGKSVHMGRVNSRTRLRYAAAIGCDSADGTYIAFGPDRNLPRVLAWLDEINA